MNRFLTVAVFVWLAAFLAFIVAGCASTSEPRIVTKEVPVPVAVKCSADPGERPAFADTPEALRAAPNIFEKTKLILAGRLQRMAWIAHLEASNAGCR